MHRKAVVTMLHRRRKNATPVLGTGEATSIVNRCRLEQRGLLQHQNRGGLQLHLR